jgi:ADP-ribose pyrophosphatase
VEHPGAVAILAQVEPDSIWCVEQFRAPIGKTLLEIPAGKLEVGETPEACAHRELGEETGFMAKQLVHLFEFYTSPGFSNEKIHLFYATDLIPGTMHLDEDEFVFGRAYPRDEIKQLLEAGQIHDAKTLIAIQWWIRLKERVRF